MKLYKRIVAALLITSVIGMNFAFINVPQVQAQWAVVDAGNIVQNTVTAVESTFSAFTNYSLQYKEYILDGIAFMIAKQILRQLTASVVNWINSGFQGNPSFLTDPAGFFQDVGDKVIGSFIAQNGDLQFLCSPFSIDLRIALALHYGSPAQDKYACTLSSVIKNVTRAGKNASINGFTAGDFSQGGWPTFVSMTSEPQNNIYGAFVQADSDISLKIGDRTVEKKDQLNQGHGFLSWETCTTPKPGDKGYVGPYKNVAGANTIGGTKFDQDYAKALNSGASPSNSLYANNQVYSPTQAVSANLNQQTCTTQTPGSVISGVLEKQLGSSVDALNLADEFNEIIDALFAQLVSTVLSTGLKAVSGKGSSDTASYLHQLQQQQTQGEKDLANQVTAQLGADAQVNLNIALAIKANRAASLAIATSTYAILDAVKKCYADKIASAQAQTIPNQNAITHMQTEYNAVDTIMNTQVAPAVAQLSQTNSDADTEIQILQKITGDAASSTNIADLDAATRAYSLLIQNHALLTGADTVKSQTELKTTQTLMNPIAADAASRLKACQAYTWFGNTGNTATSTQ